MKVHTLSDWLGLEGQRVVVAGAGGIGGACVAAYVQAGAQVLVTDRDEVRLEDLARTLSLAANGGGTLAADLTASGVARRVVEHAVDVLGGVDVFLHSVGINDRRPILEIDDADWDSLLAVNLTSAFRLSQAIGRVMSKQGFGRLVFLSSVSGLLAHKNHGPYAASKGGLNQMMRVMAAEWAASGITVNAVAPGYIETPLTQKHLSGVGVRENLVRMIPAGRLGSPEEVTGPVLFLSSRQARFVTGHVLYVDGGRTLV